MLGVFRVYGILCWVPPFFVFLGCHLDMTSIRDVTSIDNVTDKCYVIAMSNVTHKCEECNEPMTGRVDRKYCSAACRQKAYRNSRNVTVTNNVTAEPFELNTKNVYYKRAEAFWGTLYTLEAIGLIDRDEDGEAARWQVPAYPPREKKLEGRDLKNSLNELREFLNNYDQIAGNLSRLKATAEAILKFHEAP